LLLSVSVSNCKPQLPVRLSSNLRANHYCL
jgi:hypothetical protein